MQQVKNIHLNVISSYILHTEIFEPGLLPQTNEAGDNQAQVSFVYDYERLPQDRWHFHADATIRFLPFAQVSTRSTFDTTCTAAELFHPNIVKLIVKTALDTVAAEFGRLITTHRFATPNITVDDKMVEGFVPGVIDGYNSFGCKNDITNAPMKNTPGINFTQGSATALMLKGTFMIMDHVMYENPNFNLEHNREGVSQYVMPPCYETVKLKCIQIDKHAVQLSWFETLLLMFFMDGALQILLGDHADKLNPQMGKCGWTDAHSQRFVASCSEMLSTTKASMKEGGMTVNGLPDTLDWNSIIK
jgi:hypothetical protein